MLHDEIEDALMILGAGKALEEYRTFRAAGQRLPAARTLTRAAGRAAGASRYILSPRINPYGYGALALWELYEHRDQIREVIAQAEGVAASGRGGEAFGSEIIKPIQKVKRAATKADKAFRKAYKAVKPKKITKTSAKIAFTKASKIASKANPATKSRIGKGKSKVQKLARKIRKAVWGVTKRFR